MLQIFISKHIQFFLFTIYIILISIQFNCSQNTNKSIKISKIKNSYYKNNQSKIIKDKNLCSFVQKSIKHVLKLSILYSLLDRKNFGVRSEDNFHYSMYIMGEGKGITLISDIITTFNNETFITGFSNEYSLNSQLSALRGPIVHNSPLLISQNYDYNLFNIKSIEYYPNYFATIGIIETGFAGYNDGTLTISDFENNIITSKLFGGTQQEFVTDIISDNSSLIVLGYTNSGGMGIYDTLLIEYKLANNEIINFPSFFIFGSSEYSELPKRIFYSKDRSIITIGNRKNKYWNKNYIYYCIQKNLHQDEIQNCYELHSFSDYKYSLQDAVLINSNIWFTGNCLFKNKQNWIIGKIDIAENQIDIQKIDIQNQGIGYSITSDFEKNIIIGGCLFINGIQSAKILRIDSRFRLIWQQDLYYKQNSCIISLKSKSDSIYYSGYTDFDDKHDTQISIFGKIPLDITKINLQNKVNIISLLNYDIIDIVNITLLKDPNFIKIYSTDIEFLTNKFEPDFDLVWEETYFPSISPSSNPSYITTDNPSNQPSQIPSYSPTLEPTILPSKDFANLPTLKPSHQPSNIPTKSPTFFANTNFTNSQTKYTTYVPTQNITNSFSNFTNRTNLTISTNTISQTESSSTNSFLSTKNIIPTYIQNNSNQNISIFKNFNYTSFNHTELGTIYQSTNDTKIKSSSIPYKVNHNPTNESEAYKYYIIILGILIGLVIGFICLFLFCIKYLKIKIINELKNEKMIELFENENLIGDAHSDSFKNTETANHHKSKKQLVNKTDDILE